MPALFIGHGSPMYALSPNQYTQAWANIGKKIPTPSAILMISAHWYTRGIWLTAMDRPKTIHDFGGFPDELFAMEYPAPGSPQLATQVRDLLSPHFSNITLEDAEWGLDHGSWSVLKYMYPNANIPVVQMSIDATLTNQDHFLIGQHLQSLRDENVLVLSSGNVVHNLRHIARHDDAPTPLWATVFNDFFKQHLLDNDLSPLIEWQSSHQDVKMAVPTAEHYLPLIYTLGLQQKSESATIITNGIEMSSISMLSFGFGLSPS